MPAGHLRSRTLPSRRLSVRGSEHIVAAESWAIHRLQANDLAGFGWCGRLTAQLTGNTHDSFHQLHVGRHIAIFQS